jgi:hypothetical protein
MKKAEIDFNPKIDVLEEFEVTRDHTWHAGMIYENVVHHMMTSPTPTYMGERYVNFKQGEKFFLVHEKSHPYSKNAYYGNDLFGTNETTLATIPDDVLKKIA